MPILSACQTQLGCIDKVNRVFWEAKEGDADVHRPPFIGPIV